MPGTMVPPVGPRLEALPDLVSTVAGFLEIDEAVRWGLCSRSMRVAISACEEDLLQAYCERTGEFGELDAPTADHQHAMRIRLSLAGLRELCAASFRCSAKAQSQIWSGVTFRLCEETMSSETALRERSRHGKWVFNHAGTNSFASIGTPGANRVIRFPRRVFDSARLFDSWPTVYRLRSDPPHVLRSTRTCMAYYEVCISDRNSGAPSRLGGANDTFWVTPPCIAVGFCCPTMHSRALRGLPGWTRFSLGWHSDDGKFFYGQGFGTPLELGKPGKRRIGFVPFGAGDTVGVGLRMHGHFPVKEGSEDPVSTSFGGTVVLTKNGKLVGEREVLLGATWTEFFPCIGLDTSDIVQMQTHSFAFDFARYEQENMRKSTAHTNISDVAEQLA